MHDQYFLFSPTAWAHVQMSNNLKQQRVHNDASINFYLTRHLFQSYLKISHH